MQNVYSLIQNFINKIGFHPKYLNPLFRRSFNPEDLHFRSGRSGQTGSRMSAMSCWSKLW